MKTNKITYTTNRNASAIAKYNNLLETSQDMFEALETLGVDTIHQETLEAAYEDKITRLTAEGLVRHTVEITRHNKEFILMATRLGDSRNVTFLDVNQLILEVYSSRSHMNDLVLSLPDHLLNELSSPTNIRPQGRLVDSITLFESDFGAFAIDTSKTILHNIVVLTDNSK